VTEVNSSRSSDANYQEQLQQHVQDQVRDQEDRIGIADADPALAACAKTDL
jgi:hypothetical protein